MITLTILPFAFLALKRMVETPEIKWHPSVREARALREKLNMFSPKVVNGRKQYALELYLEKENVISFGKFGEKMVKIPPRYFKECETYDFLQWLEEKDMEQFHASFPEEKEKHDLEIQSRKKEIGEMLRGINKNVLLNGIR